MTGLQWLAQTGAERALNSVPEGLLIATLVWLLLKAFERQSSRTRFAIWFGTFVAIAALPFAPAVVSSTHATGNLSAQITLAASWARVIFICWAVIAGVRVARVIAGIWKLRRLRNNSAEVPTEELPPAVQPAFKNFQAIRRLTIRRSRDARVPMAIGFFRPAVLIPEWAFDELPAEDLKAVLLHEFAHLRRGDDWTNLAQKLVRAVFFFHPAVWWVENKLALEREMACDELVVAETADRQAYAACLVSIAEKSFVRRGLAMAQSAISHARQTSLRLARILDAQTVVPGIFKPGLAVAAGLAALCLVALPRVPQLITFKDAAPRQSLSAPTSSMSAGVIELGAAGIPAVAHPASLKSARIIAVKQKHVHTRPTLLVRTASRQVIPRSQLLIFVQTTEYNGLGAAKVNYCVWRLTFPDADRNNFRAEIIAKSI